MNNIFVNQFVDRICFSYTAFDRVVCRGYIRSLFVEGAVVNLMRCLGFKSYSNEKMRILTDNLNRHIQSFASTLNVPILWWPKVNGGKNGAKQSYVEQHFLKRTKKILGNHVFCILADMERAKTFITKPIQTKSGSFFQKIFKISKPVKHYYIYFNDESLGLCFLKICTYIPFQSEFYFNGHNALGVYFDKKNIAYRMKDNALVEVQNPDLVNDCMRELDGKIVQDRINFWTKRFFRFRKGKYSTTSKYLQHDWYVYQAEVCSNVIFKSARFAAPMFDKIIASFSRFGLPDHLSEIFQRRRIPKETKTTRRLYDNKACLKSWILGNSIKLYNKIGYFYRVETTINNPKKMSLKKPILYLQSYYWKGVEANNKYYSCLAQIDCSTVTEIKKTTEMTSSPDVDLRKTRQVELMKELLKPKYASSGFRIKHLKLTQFSNPAQIRYEMKKLRSKGWVKKIKKSSSYQVTLLGWKSMWVQISSVEGFKNPMTASLSSKRRKNSCTHSDEIDTAYKTLNQGLDQMASALQLIA